MIVKDKSASILKANQVSSKLIEIMTEETKEFSCDDDPAEQIYLGCHIVGSLLSKICISLEGYGKIYGIESLTTNSILEWVNLIAREHINLNQKGDINK